MVNGGLVGSVCSALFSRFVDFVLDKYLNVRFVVDGSNFYFRLRSKMRPNFTVRPAAAASQIWPIDHLSL